MTTRTNLAPEPVSGHPDPLQILVDASSRLLGTKSSAEVLSQILRLAGEAIRADAYAVWRAFKGGDIWRILTHEGLSASYRKEITAAKQVTLDEPFIADDVYADKRLAPWHASYRAEGICSMVAVPMRIENEILGTITFYYRHRHTFTDIDLKYAEALANLSASALYTSELHEKNQREKRRLAFLAEASAVLASSLDYEVTLERVAHLAVPEIADWCSVHIVEEGAVTNLAVAHADPAMLKFAKEFARKYPEQLREDRGMGKVLRTGESELYPNISDELLVEAAKDEEHLRMMRYLGITSVLIVPLVTRGRILGAIRMIAAQPGRCFEQDDLALAEDLARRAAAAVDNATLHRELLKSESSLRLSHAASKMGSWSWDIARNKIYWSEEFKTLHGLPIDTPSGYESGASLIHPEDRARVLAELEEIYASAAHEVVSEHRSITADGRVIWIYSRGRIERDTDGKALRVYGISMDVTDRKAAEDLLRRTEKLAAAGRLAATVAHEINNPLEAVTNLVYLARSATQLHPQVNTYLAMAEQELQRIEHIAKQTLGFYRESTTPRITVLAHPIEEIAQLYQRRSRTKDQDLVLDLDMEIAANVVPGEIKQVMANLLSNAMDATPHGGSIHLSLHSAGPWAEVRVSDSGSGIPEKDRRRVFEPFFTTKADVGTGLGLWVSKGIVEKYGGTISYLSQEESGAIGATFVIQLPRIMASEPSADDEGLVVGGNDETASAAGAILTS